MNTEHRSLIPFTETIDAAGVNAPWLTMVHAAALNRRIFSSQVRAFQDRFRILLIDLPGHGNSAELPGPYGFEEYADSVLAALDATGVKTTHYVGTHTGAAVGLMLASRHPARFDSLVLEGPPMPGVDMPSVLEAIGDARATASDRGVDAARREWYEKGWYDVMRAHPERCRAAEHLAILSEFTGRPWLDTSRARPVTPISRRLSSLEQPVLLMNGKHDVAEFLTVADEMERLLPNVTRLRIPEAGGFPLWERPETVNTVVREFLEAQSLEPPQ